VIALVRTEPLAERFAKESQMAGRRLGLDIRLIDVRDIDDLQRSFVAVAREGSAVCLVPSAFLFTHRKEIAALATKARVPVLGWESGVVTSGALMSYGPSTFDAGRRAAGYVDKILKGAKPADLPVEQPTTFELVINAKTAKSLGLTIPPSLLLRADQIID
jgi:putative ABC transport system substrate-binding protein